MKKGIQKKVDRLLRTYFHEEAVNFKADNPSANVTDQLRIKHLADKIIDYATSPRTNEGIVEVIFAERAYKDLSELYMQNPLIVSFRNFMNEDIVLKNLLLTKHTLVVTRNSDNIEVFTTSITNEDMLYLLYRKGKSL